MMQHIQKVVRWWVGGISIALILLAMVALPLKAHAQGSGEFSLQVTPSPLVATVQPGQTTQIELRIRNAGSLPENLKIEPRSFDFDSKTQQVHLSDQLPKDISNWISFASPTFTVQPNQWFSEQVRFAVPANAGFSYSFALVISRVAPAQQPQSGNTLKGAVAVFTLVNVDRPGVVRKVDAVSFTTTKKVYEVLPAEFKVRLKNSGNSIVQPLGNIFVQRTDHDTTPLSTLRVNSGKGYILPGTTRTLTSDWQDGFQVDQTTIGADGKSKTHLVWDWANLSHLRIGRYTAKLVAVYNDGTRDVPIEGVVSFWVIPWKLLLGALVVLLLLGAGIWTSTRTMVRVAKRGKARLTHGGRPKQHNHRSQL